ncbi:Protein of unknown function [Pyronema omphalodes CBS 100304]|uniref:Uncharacterized protein n=1 Tax=Pyronema omphalodes (strain CBS 100304) TaxID=1076935 RepID=U4L3V8_PYROM|nr:Protein of unknown function [Pyronema omphalodes CBS 100304]
MQHYNPDEQDYAMDEDSPLRMEALAGPWHTPLAVGHGHPVAPSGVIRNHSSSSRPAPYTRSKPIDIPNPTSREPKASKPRRIPNYNDANPIESDYNWSRHVQVVGEDFDEQYNHIPESHDFMICGFTVHCRCPIAYPWLYRLEAVTQQLNLRDRKNFTADHRHIFYAAFAKFAEYCAIAKNSDMVNRDKLPEPFRQLITIHAYLQNSRLFSQYALDVIKWVDEIFNNIALPATTTRTFAALLEVLDGFLDQLQRFN